MKDLVEIPSILCQLWGKVDMKLNCILFFRSSHYERRNIMKLDFVIFFGSIKNWSHFQVSFSQILRSTSHPEPGNRNFFFLDPRRQSARGK